MPSTLSADLFFFQPKNQKRRFQQFILTKIFGIDIALVGINDDPKTEMLHKFLAEIDGLLTEEIIANRQSSEILDLCAEIDLTQLLFWCCKCLLYHKMNTCTESRERIIAEYSRFCRSRKLWQHLEEISPGNLQTSITQAELLFFDYLRQKGFSSFSIGIYTDNDQQQSLDPAPAGQSQNEANLDALFNSTFTVPNQEDQETNFLDCDQSPVQSSPPGYSSDPELD
jgi:hypothetical protein